MSDPLNGRSPIEPAVAAAVQQYINGEIGDESFKLLESALRSSTEVIDYFIDECSFHDTLSVALHDGKLDRDVVAEDQIRDLAIMDELVNQALYLRRRQEIEGYASELLAVEHRHDQEQVANLRASITTGHRQRRVIVIPKAAVWLLCAALIGLIASSAVWLHATRTTVVDAPTSPPQTPGQPGEPLQVATVAGAVDARWADGTEVQVGEVIFTHPVELTSGVIKLNLTNGVQLTVEAPSRFTPHSDMLVGLDAGKLVGQVPANAHRFTIRTQQADIVDLGTEFAVEVDPAGVSQVHVLDGLVQIEPGEGSRLFEPVLAEAGSAFGLSGSRSPEPIDLADNRFYRWVPGPYERMIRDASPLAYWRFNTRDEHGMVNGLGRAQAALSGVTASYSDENTPRVSEAGDRSLWLEKAGHYICTREDLGLDELQGFTVEAWVWVPRDVDGYMRVVSNRGKTERKGWTSSGFAIGVSGKPEDRVDGPVVMVTRFGVFDAYATHAIPVEQWAHLAVAFDDANGFIIYVNGQRQPARTQLKTDLDPDRGEGRFRVGGGSLLHQSLRREAWVGGIDELAIYDRVLEEEVIAAHADINFK